MKNPIFAFFLSLFVPGLGQLYLKEWPKGLSMLCVTAGIAVAFLTSRSMVAFFLLGLIYLFIIVPAAVDAYQTASGKPRTFKSDSIPYVLIMLCIVGPFAIPLLWQSPRFPRAVKIILTTLVTLIMILGLLLINLVGPYLDGQFK